MNVFEEAVVEYDKWFETYKWLCQSAVKAVRKFMPETGKGLAIGVEKFQIFQTISRNPDTIRSLEPLEKISEKDCLS